MEQSARLATDSRPRAGIVSMEKHQDAFIATPGTFQPALEHGERKGVSPRGDKRLQVQGGEILAPTHFGRADPAGTLTADFYSPNPPGMLPESLHNERNVNIRRGRVKPVWSAAFPCGRL